MISYSNLEEVKMLRGRLKMLNIRRTYEAGTKGFEEGEKCGEVRIAKLIIELNRQGRMEDIVKMAADSECRKKLLEEFHFD